MAARNAEEPKKIHLSEAQFEALKERVETNSLTQDDLKIFLHLITFNIWLQERLSRAKLTMKKLRHLFGFKSEKKNKKSDSSDSKSDPDSTLNSESTDLDKNTAKTAVNDELLETQPNDSNTQKTPVWDPEKNHGRRSVAEYTGCPEIPVDFKDPYLKQGFCPDCAALGFETKITKKSPEVIILFDAQPLICGARYVHERGRCTVCAKYFTAATPPEIENKPKYSFSVITALCIYHYIGGLPFKRIEMLQAAQGVPLSDSTQFDLVNHFYQQSVVPVFLVLKYYAAQGHIFYFDDTRARVLTQITENKQQQNKKDRKATHATVILSEYDNHRIYLVNTNTKTAGKEFKNLLELRDENQGDFISMSDALSHNFPDLEETLIPKWIIALCLSHGRRKFFELLDEDNVDLEIKTVLEIIGNVYQNEKHCKDHNLSDLERLHYHQKHSAPLMAALKVWFNNQLLYREVEPNSDYGDNIRYILSRWYWFTQFLRTPGAPLDNNICEQAIKINIRYLKNSLFFRNFYGASIADSMMTLAQTAMHNDVNVFDYFNELQHYSDEVQKTPEKFLPWNYRESIEEICSVPNDVVAANSS